MFRRILLELRHHLPFTLGGAVLGIVLLVVLTRLPESVSQRMFETFHPLHVLASSMATASMYGLYRCTADGRLKCNLLLLLLVGYAGSVGIGTLSDSLIPLLGEHLLGLPGAEAHIGFIELWHLVNPAALLGIAISYFRPMTKVPHFGHVLLSTLASLAHIGMALDGALPVLKYLGLFAFLLVAVWVPCTVSDIAFPLLFVRDRGPRASAG
ncbi:MAG: hypothetical protein JSU73_11580 [candidate division WOR-3 bacterium]|nr:MAG: hypothetical protein JSU73_11580 [candidate division WOR-3 bacterium]